eukprot:jgi/Mesvir1/18943/Mv18914-RA.1
MANSGILYDELPVSSMKIQTCSCKQTGVCTCGPVCRCPVSHDTSGSAHGSSRAPSEVSISIKPPTIHKETTLHVGGMTCVSCVNSIQRVFARQPGIVSVTVSLLAEEATVLHERWLAPETVATIISDAGFDATVSKTQLTTPRGGDMRSITLQVTGMTCASCSGAVERALSAIEGVSSVQVSLLAGTARVLADGTRVSTATLLEAVDAMGYAAALVMDRPHAPTAASQGSRFHDKAIDANVIGSNTATIRGGSAAAIGAAASNNSASDAVRMRTQIVRIVRGWNPRTAQALSSLPGCMSARFDPTTSMLDVSWDPGLTKLRDIIAVLQRLGVAADARDPAILRKLSALGKHDEVAAWRRLALFSIVFAVPFFIWSMLLMGVPAVMSLRMRHVIGSLDLGTLIDACLAAPVQVVGGARFYRHAYAALRHRQLTMDVLVATGTSVAFLYSLATMVVAAVSRVPPVNFFDTSVSLITFLSIGRFLENKAKGSASAALSKLLALSPPKALLVLDSPSEADNPQLPMKDSQPPLVLERLPPGPLAPRDLPAVGTQQLPRSEARDGKGAHFLLAHSPGDDDPASSLMTPLLDHADSSVRSATGEDEEEDAEGAGDGPLLEPLVGEEASSPMIRAAEEGYAPAVGTVAEPQEHPAGAGVKSTSPSMQLTLSSAQPTSSAGPVGAATAAVREIESELLEVGDVIRVPPGALVAADGTVLWGTASVDESMVTGESLPVTKTLGDKVTGGTLNTSGVLHVRVDALGADTMLSRVAAAVEDAQTAKAGLQRLADRLSAVFIPTILLLGLATVVGWLGILEMVLGGVVPRALRDIVGEGPAPLALALRFGISVVIVACPCALGLATPTALMVGTGVGARCGVLLKGGASLEAARRVSVILLDKTNTLTTGRMTVDTVLPLGAFRATSSQGDPYWEGYRVQGGDDVLGPSCNGADASSDGSGDKLAEGAVGKRLQLPEAAWYTGKDARDAQDAQNRLRLVLQALEMAEQHSEHPLAKAVVAYLAQAKLGRTRGLTMVSFESVAGFGISAVFVESLLGADSDAAQLGANAADASPQAFSLPVDGTTDGQQGQPSLHNAGSTDMGGSKSHTLLVGNARWMERHSIAFPGVDQAVSSGNGHPASGRAGDGVSPGPAASGGNRMFPFRSMNGGRESPRTNPSPGHPSCCTDVRKQQLVGLETEPLVVGVGGGDNSPVAARGTGLAKSPPAVHGLKSADSQSTHATPAREAIRHSKEGRATTDVLVAWNGSPALQILVTDTLKPDAVATVKRLKALGIEPILVTGDSAVAARRVAHQTGIRQMFAQQSPMDKAALVRKYQSRGETVAMLGDGVNDSPALAAADLGVSVYNGTDIALEAAGVVLMRDRLGDVVTAIRLARAIVQRIRVNFAFALVYNVVMIPVAAGVGVPVGVVLHPALAGIAMALSSVSVVISSLMLKQFKP